MLLITMYIVGTVCTQVAARRRHHPWLSTWHICRIDQKKNDTARHGTARTWYIRCFFFSKQKGEGGYRAAHFRIAVATYWCWTRPASLNDWLIYPSSSSPSDRNLFSPSGQERQGGVLPWFCREAYFSRSRQRRREGKRKKERGTRKRNKDSSPFLETLFWCWYSVLYRGHGYLAGTSYLNFVQGIACG